MRSFLRILSDRHIKRLFSLIILYTVLFALAAFVLAVLRPQNARLYVPCLFLCDGAVSLLTLFLYFRNQDRILSQAAAQLQEYRCGNPQIRLACDEEGQLCRLFHEINSLAAVLSAHAENEKNAKKFMKDTISDISHQLKTPLAALNIYNGIVQADTSDPQTVSEFAALSEYELDRIENLVQNLLKITKLDAGTVVFDKAQVPISAMMEDLKRQFAFRADQEGKILSFSGPDEAVLTCDRVWLTEALGNLIKNALDHTQAGGRIQIQWETFPSMLQILVKDDGCGICPEDLHHIFKRFYRSRLSQDTQGIGLGLPLAKAVVEAHNGTIQADSEPGKGSVFTIHFLIPTKL